MDSTRGILIELCGSQKKTNEVAEWLGDIYYDQMESGENVGQETVQNEFEGADCIRSLCKHAQTNISIKRTCSLYILTDIG